MTAFATVVSDATINYGLNQITINGTGFHSQLGVAPKVTFDSVPLTVVSFSPTQVVATLPSNIQPGTYTVSVTNSQSNAASLDVTYGAAGPMGLVGPQGPAGR
jgi:uncharacterized protein (TIGR03437 family)